MVLLHPEMCLGKNTFVFFLKCTEWEIQKQNMLRKRVLYYLFLSLSSPFLRSRNQLILMLYCSKMLF